MFFVRSNKNVSLCIGHLFKTNDEQTITRIMAPNAIMDTVGTNQSDISNNDSDETDDWQPATAVTADDITEGGDDPTQPGSDCNARNNSSVLC